MINDVVPRRLSFDTLRLTMWDAVVEAVRERYAAEGAALVLETPPLPAILTMVKGGVPIAEIVTRIWGHGPRKEQPHG